MCFRQLRSIEQQPLPFPTKKVVEQRSYQVKKQTKPNVQSMERPRVPPLPGQCYIPEISLCQKKIPQHGKACQKSSKH